MDLMHLLDLRRDHTRNRADSETMIRQQLRLIERNYIQGVFGFTMVTMLTAFLVYQVTFDSRAIVWASVMAAESILGIIFFSYWYPNIFGKDIRADTYTISVLILVQNLSYAYLPFTFIPEGTTYVVMIISMITIAFGAGSIALSSPFFIGFIASTYGSMLAVAYGLYVHQEPSYAWVSVGVIIMLAGMTWFAIKISQTIQSSITTSIENESLVGSLRSALDEAADANQAKSVFLASASHDLRQPLHAIGLLNESLGHTVLNVDQREIHEHMKSALGSTREMLDALLNISKLDAGAIESKPKAFFVRTVLNKLEVELAPAADEKGLVFRTRESIAAAFCDPFILELILRNLVANAIRYTDKGGLLVACRKRGENLLFEVWDTGIGIEPDKYQEIFKPFHQLDNPERDSRKGFGLGLAIANGLANTIGSKLNVRSTPNKGSVFSFEVPNSKQDVIEDINVNMQLNRFDDVTVMVVDDDPHILASMKSVLTAWGCQCILAESVEEALSSPNIKQTQLILTDYRLREGVTGKDVVQVARQKLGQDMPAIIITGDTASERIRDAQSSGALLLHKPASALQLHSLMQRLLGSS